MPLVIRPFVLRLLAVAGLVVVSSAMAQTPAAGASKINDDQLLSYLPKDTVPTGTVPWLTFRQVKLVEEKKDGKTIAVEVKVGDRVLYGKYSGTEIKKDGKEMLIIRESDILAVLS